MASPWAADYVMQKCERVFSTPAVPYISLSPACQYSCTFNTKLLLVRMEHHTRMLKHLNITLDEYYQLTIRSLQPGENLRQ